MFHPLKDSKILSNKFLLQWLSPSRNFPRCSIISTCNFIFLDFCVIVNIIFCCFFLFIPRHLWILVPDDLDVLAQFDVQKYL